MKLKYGELFCGPGGLAIGAKNTSISVQGEKYSIDPIWAIDNDTATCRTFKHNVIPYNSEIINWPPEKKLLRDNKKLIINDDIEKIDDFDLLPKIDILAFGFPCNDFSQVGKMKGLNGKYGGLYKYGIEALNAHNPEFFIAENVSGLASWNTSVFEKIQDEMASAGTGYNLSVHKYFLEQYGIPQTRHRIFIIGFKRSLNKLFKVPLPLNETITAGQAIDDGIVYGEGPLNGSVKNHDLEEIVMNDTVRLRLYNTNPGQNAWDANLPKEAKLNVKGAYISSIYKKIDPNKPAYTVTGSGGGGTHMYYWAKNKKDQRALTNRERARLQTFKDKFVFFGNRTEVRKQIGMAVPVKASEILFKACLYTYAGKYYNFVEKPYYPYKIYFKQQSSLF